MNLTALRIVAVVGVTAIMVNCVAFAWAMREFREYCRANDWTVG